MGTFKNIIAATAAATALMAPLIGTAEAESRYNGFRGDTYKSEKHDRYAVKSPRHRYEDSVRDRYVAPTPRHRYIDKIRTRPTDRRYNVHTPRIDARIERQSNRIARGRSSGRLSRLEAFRLRSGLFAIRSARRFARFDGRISRTERRNLMDMLDRNSNRIRRLARNDNGRRYR